MTAAKGGGKLNPAQGGNPVCIPSIGSDNVYHRDCHKMTMARLAEQFAQVRAAVFQRKAGRRQHRSPSAWDFLLDWTPLSGGLAGLQPVPGQEFDTGSTIIRTMEKNLGLKLEQRERADTGSRHRSRRRRSDRELGADRSDAVARKVDPRRIPC